MYAIGAPVYLTAVFTNSAGSLVDPTAVTVLITLPDGTNTGPLAATKDSVGNYHYIYTPTESGIHQWYFAGTGSNATVQLTDLFTVAPATSTAIISINDAKLLLNKLTTSHIDDGELLAFIQSATEIITAECGFIVPRTFTEVTSPVLGSGGRQQLMVTKTPLLSVASVTPIQVGLPTIDITTLQIDGPAGIIWLANWYSWYGPQTIVYTVGRTSVPAALQDACKLIVAYLWETQQGGAVSAAVSAFGGDEMTTGYGGMPGFPTRALDLMRMSPYFAAPGLA